MLFLVSVGLVLGFERCSFLSIFQDLRRSIVLLDSSSIKWIILGKEMCKIIVVTKSLLLVGACYRLSIYLVFI